MRQNLKALYADLEYHRPTKPAQAMRKPKLAKATAAGAPVQPNLHSLARELQKQFEAKPERTLTALSEAVGQPVPEVQFLRMLAELKGAEANPRAYLTALAERRAALATICRPPAGLPRDINACSRRYEIDDIRWVTRCGWYLVKRLLGTLTLARFPKHNEFSSGFDYKLRNQAGDPFGPGDRIVVALFSDFATGEYHSRYIANEIAKHNPPYAIHLGDVYYVGERQEFVEHFVAPLAPVRKASRLFTLNANHEMYSGGFAYFDYLASNRTLPPNVVKQEQEGSYFCLSSDRYQIIGIDTAYDYKHNGQFRSPALRTWLTERLQRGKDATPRRTNILLSQNEPFGLGDKTPTRLFDQIMQCATRKGRCMLDFWFWGDEHYCVLYQKTLQVPFVGSCIGHAGHPVNWSDVNQRAARDAAGGTFARAAWIDQSPRFPNFREQELGNSGYCIMTLGPQGIGLTYVDWRGKQQHTATFHTGRSSHIARRVARRRQEQRQRTWQ